MSGLLRGGLLVGPSATSRPLLRSSGRWLALAGNVGLNLGTGLLTTAAGIALARQVAGGA